MDQNNCVYILSEKKQTNKKRTGYFRKILLTYFRVFVDGLLFGMHS